MNLIHFCHLGQLQIHVSSKDNHTTNMYCYTLPCSAISLFALMYTHLKKDQLIVEALEDVSIWNLCRVCNAVKQKIHSVQMILVSCELFINIAVCSCTKQFVKWPEHICIISALNYHKWNAVKDAFYARDTIRYQACSPSFWIAMTPVSGIIICVLCVGGLLWG